jgi:diguanylate cyclase (GGDEF)-like protein
LAALAALLTLCWVALGQAHPREHVHRSHPHMAWGRRHFAHHEAPSASEARSSERSDEGHPSWGHRGGRGHHYGWSKHSTKPKDEVVKPSKPKLDKPKVDEPPKLPESAEPAKPDKPDKPDEPTTQFCHNHCSTQESNGSCHDHCFGTGEAVCHDHCYGAFETNCHDHCYGSGDTYCHDHCYGAGDSYCHDHCWGSEDVSCHDHCFAAGASNCVDSCFTEGGSTTPPSSGPPAVGPPTIGPPSSGPPSVGPPVVPTGGRGGQTLSGGQLGRGQPGGGNGGGIPSSSLPSDHGLGGGTQTGIPSSNGAGGVGLGTGTAGTSGGAAGRLSQPLAAGTASVVAHGRTGRQQTATGGLNPRVGSHGLAALPASAPAALLEHFIQVIPWWIWLGFALALALAAGAGVAAVRSARRARARAGEVASVTADAMTDPLTGILNRRGFTTVAQRELERAQRYGHPLALAFVDVRGLKSVNDTRGHQAGDQLLKQVAALLKESSRSHDIVGRIGGDELAVMLTEQGVDGMTAVLRRVRAQLPATRSALGFDHDWDLTIGMAVFPRDGHSVEDLLATADRRLYMQRGIELR